METFSALLAICAGNSPVPGEFPEQRPVTRRFGSFFDPRLNKRLSKQSWGWWFETLSCPLWRHCNDITSYSKNMGTYHVRGSYTVVENVVRSTKYLHSSFSACLLWFVFGLCSQHLPKLLHDDVMKWKHFPCYWTFVREIHRYPVNSPDKGQWRGALMFSLICARINARVNNGEAGDLRRHRAHYDDTVMLLTPKHRHGSPTHRKTILKYMETITWNQKE